MQLVAEEPLPISLGNAHPRVMVVEQDGLFRIREIVVDRDAAQAAASASSRTRSPSWMPEHYYTLGRPTGTIFAEARSRAELVEVMRTMTWHETW
ncbi:MAG: hypothetical protein M3680_19995 [Myxococcota bacterium]|nr:hypothetical protein [Myxococcota bacterium]